MKNRRHYNLFITENTRNKQTKNEKYYGKNKKVIDPEVNKIDSCRKKWDKNVPCATQS